jgi:prepilin-type N-terminal cleavage/methylation domain-containing protein
LEYQFHVGKLALLLLVINLLRSCQAICEHLDFISLLTRLPRSSHRMIYNNMKTVESARKKGFTLVEIMIVVAIIGVLAAIAIPNFIHTRAKSQATACINNMRQIDSAIQQFAMEKGLKSGDTINYPTDITPYIKLNANSSLPSCPGSGVYTPTLVGNIPSVVCSLSDTVDPPHILP